jgi:hypothetical protein
MVSSHLRVAELSSLAMEALSQPNSIITSGGTLINAPSYAFIEGWASYSSKGLLLSRILVTTGIQGPGPRLPKTTIRERRETLYHG